MRCATLMAAHEVAGPAGAEVTALRLGVGWRPDECGASKRAIRRAAVFEVRPTHLVSSTGTALATV